MAEYINIDKNVIVYDTRGKKCEVTVRHILTKNRGEFEVDDVQPVVRGKWVLEYEPNGKPYCFHCSVCDGDFHYIGITTKYDFCPNCGADMREES